MFYNHNSFLLLYYFPVFYRSLPTLLVFSVTVAVPTHSDYSDSGISCVQTAEGALNEVHDMLQRMNELAVKGANGTLTTTDRSYVQMEVRQLMSEIDRIQSTTTFNEQNLLDGSFQKTCDWNSSP